mmetsp:Transcript_4992/g.11902  ORF Transcript_4992/g.11902 Transcript_4992/m.11902 type:complete len:100 (+) Transcript_4992:463-762(+)
MCDEDEIFDPLFHIRFLFVPSKYSDDFAFAAATQERAVCEAARRARRASEVCFFPREALSLSLSLYLSLSLSISSHSSSSPANNAMPGRGAAQRWQQLK